MARKAGLRERIAAMRRKLAAELARKAVARRAALRKELKKRQLEIELRRALAPRVSREEFLKQAAGGGE